MTSACRPKALQSTKRTSSRSSPLWVLNLRLQAKPNSATGSTISASIPTAAATAFEGPVPRRTLLARHNWLRLHGRHLLLIEVIRRGYHHPQDLIREVHIALDRRNGRSRRGEVADDVQ